MHLQAVDQKFDLPAKEKKDICTIMYTSGTTGDPKGVLISNASIICLIAGVDQLLNCVNEEVRCSNNPSKYVTLPCMLANIYYLLPFDNFSWQKTMFTCHTFLLHISSIVLWRSCLCSMVPLLDSGVG
jgi:acyl-CoA synthetase (AMP-forming)/AMP-acid ligase II